jgi:hypothetical protein
MRIGSLLVGCILAWHFGSVQAAEKFSPKYVENLKHVKRNESKVEQRLTIAGMAVDSKVTSFSVSTLVAGERDSDGKLAVEESVTQLQVDLELPNGVKLQFDSANPDKPADDPLWEPMLEMFRAMLKSSRTMILNREDRVAEVKVANHPKEKLPQEFQSYFDPARLKREFEQAWLFLPDSDVGVGAAWERMIEQDLGGGQTMSFKVKFAYAGPETRDGRTCHKFASEHREVMYSMDPNANPMVQVSNSDLKIVKSSGTILYDPETGKIPVRESQVQITGTLTLVINGQEFPSELNLTMTETETVTWEK